MTYDFTKQPGYKELDEATFQAFMDSHPHGATLDEIGQVMGMTRARVSQIVNRSLVKLRTECARRGIAADDCPQTETQWEKMQG